MIKRILQVLIVSLVLSGSLGVQAQDPHFSQYYANPIFLNPAFAGTNICPRVVMNYRNQWPSIPGAFETFNASYDQHFDKLYGGLGILAYNDKQGEGALNTTSISAMYSVQIQAWDDFYIRAGFQGTYVDKSLDFYKLTFEDMIDPKQGFINPTLENKVLQSVNYFDLSAGLLGYSEKFYIGFAAHHLNEPEEGFNTQSKLPMKFTAHTGFVLPLIQSGYRPSDDDVTISPNFMFQKQWYFHQLNYGFYVNKKPMVLGLWYRHFVSKKYEDAKYYDALVALIGFEVDRFKFGYSYDITLSQLSTAAGGAHEFSFTLKLHCPQKRKKFKVINCPAF